MCILHFIAHRFAPADPLLFILPLSPSERRPVSRPCPCCFTVHYVLDRDHLVHMGLMLEAAKAQGERYIGLTGAAVRPVVLLRLAVLAREPHYTFCDKFARLHARSFIE